MITMMMKIPSNHHAPSVKGMTNFSQFRRFSVVRISASKCANPVDVRAGIGYLDYVNFDRFHRLSTLPDPSPRNPSTDIGRRTWNPIPLPHRTIPEPKGNDLDFVNVAHSHVLHSDWTKLDKLVSGLNAFRVKRVLLKLQSDYALSLKFSNWVEVHNQNVLTLEVVSMILHILTKSRKFKSSESILKKLLESCSMDFHPKLFDALLYSYRMCDSSPRVFDSLFKTYAHMRRFRVATDTFCRMKEYGFLPTIESCNAYMSSLISSNRADIALVFYKQIRHSRIPLNVYTLNMVIGALCQLEKLERAVEVFMEMENMGFSPTVASYNTLIDGYCKKGLLAAGMKLKHTMEKNGIRPSVITFNTLIHGFCKDEKLHEAYKLFREMKSVDVGPNIVTYNTLISGYSQTGNTEKGSQLFEEMSRNGIKADILTYNALIMGLCNKGKTRKAAYLVKELDKRKLVPNSSTFAALISGQCARKNPERAFQLYKSMLKSGCRPNEHTLKMLLSSFMHNDDYVGAFEVLKEMIGRAITPDSDLLYHLCNGLHQRGKDRLIVNLSKGMDDRWLAQENYEKRNFISESDIDGNETKGNSSSPLS